jgi:hypothetical protein
MAENPNDNIQQPPRRGLLREIFEKGLKDGTIKRGSSEPAERIDPLSTAVFSERAPKPISLEGAGMSQPRRAIPQPKPKLVGKVEKGEPVKEIMMPQASDIQSLVPQRKLTEAEIEQNRTKYVPDAIENTIITARNSVRDKGYFDNLVAPNLRKTLSEDIKSGVLNVGLNKDRYPIVKNQVSGVIENIILGIKDRGNTIKGLDEYDRLDDKGKIEFFSGRSTKRIPTLSQVGSPTKDMYSGQPVDRYQGAVDTERGTIGEIAYGVGGVLPDIATGIVTSPLNVVLPGYSVASVSAIQGRTGRINAAQQAFQVAKSNGLNDEESLEVAKNAEKTGAVTGALEGAASQFFGSKILKAFAQPAAKTALTGFVNQSKQFLKNAVTTTGKSALPLAADMGVAGGMELARQEALADQNLENPNRDKDIMDNMKMEGAVGLAFAIVGGATKVPKYLKSYATSALANLDPNDLVDYATELELTGEAPAGFTESVRNEVKKYNDAKKAVGGTVDAEIEPTIVGLIMKKKDLQDKLKQADETIKPQIQAQIDEVNARITTTLETKVPEEVDDKTLSRIEQDTAQMEATTSEAVQEPQVPKRERFVKEGDKFYEVTVDGRQMTRNEITEDDYNRGVSSEASQRAEQQSAQVQADATQEVGVSDTTSQAEVVTPVQDKAKRAGDAIRAFKIEQNANTLDTNIFGIPTAIYNGVLEAAATAVDLKADVVQAIRKYLSEQNPQDIAGLDENALIEDVRAKIAKQESKPKPTLDDILKYASSSEKRIQEGKKSFRKVNETLWRRLLKAVDDNQVNVIKELRKTGKFSDLLIAALELIRYTSADSNERINQFNKNVYEGLSDKPTIQLDGYEFSERLLLDEVIKAKRLIEIQRMLGDKFARFQALDNEYNTALAEYEAIDEATAKNKKELDKIAKKINEINKRIVDYNLGKQDIQEDDYLKENSKDRFKLLVDEVRVEHKKADKIMSEMESVSDKIKEATSKVRELRNKRQDALEYIANRGVLEQSQDGAYSLGNYKIGEVSPGVPYTSTEAQAFLDAVPSYEKFSDIDARSEAAFDAFKSILDEQYEAGLVSQAVYDDLSKYKYVPIRYISEVLGEENSAFMKTRAGAGIKSLTGGSDGAVITNYSTLFNIYATTALKNIATNKALQLLESSIKSELPTMKATNVFNQDIAVKLAETDKKDDGSDKVDKFGNKVYLPVKDGYTNLKVYNKDGTTMLTVPTWFAKEFYANSEYNKSLSMISSILGINLLRKAATIANPAFGIAQLLTLDPIQAILTAKGFNWIVPIAYAEIASQWPSVAKSISKKDALYNEALRNGVFGDMALKSGIDKFYNNTIFTGIKTIDDNLADKSLFEKVLFGADISRIPGVKQVIEFGESFVGASEKMTRLIVYKKAKKYFMDKGSSAEEAGQLAASEARNTANFSRAGDVIKQANHVIPYLSAGYATKRAAVKGFKKDPARATFVVAQMALGGMALTLWSIGRFSNDEKEKEYWGEMYKALPDYYKRNYVVIRNPVHNIGDNITNAFIRIPLPFLAKEMYSAIVSSKMSEYMDKPATSLDAGIDYIASSMDMIGLADASVPPLVSSIIKLKYNIDPYTRNKVVYDESTGEYSFLEEKEGTLPMIQAAAEKTRAFSAPRLQAAIESYTGKFDRNPITQITVNALNSMYELAAGKENSVIKSIKEDPNKLIEAPLSSVSSRFFATPKKYYDNKFNTLMLDRMYAEVDENMPDILISKSKDRLKKLGIAGIAGDSQSDFFVKEANSFLDNVERDLGKKERIKYERMLINGSLAKVKDILRLDISGDNSLRGLLTEKNPSIKGRAAYTVINDAEDDPNKKARIATALIITGFWKDKEVVQSYLEEKIKNEFGPEYKDKFKSLLRIRGNKADAIEKMYRESKEFKSDSNEAKETKLSIIENLRFVYSGDASTLNIKGDPLKEKLFGFDYLRK